MAYLNTIIAYHGCDQSIVNKILNAETREHLLPSKNDYDWLGSGIYFWENDPVRALEWARSRRGKKGSSKIENPSCIGAMINTGYSFDLTTRAGLNMLKEAYKEFETSIKISGLECPSNEPAHKKDDERLLRKLDCAVINYIHAKNKDNPFDSVRSTFTEGSELYKGAGFREKNHIQICVINTNCIMGYFKPVIF